MKMNKILDYLSKQDQERSWIEISGALKGADFNTLLELIQKGKVKQRQIGEHLYYSFNHVKT